MIVATCFINFTSISAQAGGSWNDQYCNIEVTQVELKNADGEFGLSEKEKEDILKSIEAATDGLQKEVDDIQLGISESGT